MTLRSRVPSVADCCTSDPACPCMHGKRFAFVVNGTRSRDTGMRCIVLIVCVVQLRFILFVGDTFDFERCESRSGAVMGETVRRSRVVVSGSLMGAMAEPSGCQARSVSSLLRSVSDV